ncbi:hypothetical protein EPR50_G00081710 [Perca flavescens]|uniref:PDZ domain-containing protein n=1 Tax=Perca flavescens TaxID=8167 RepID=A0A484D708_PERFV|nr:PDZ domain-containing protein MAGIX [Perca flavescens]TDH11034.1 hypothetical protein EPR50_G00081710 [Perca flavescens]
MSHRFMTVRRGSPAARSGQVQPGDQLETVEGRPVSGLQHRDLAQILRRAGTTLRLSITPRPHSSPVSEAADLDMDGRLMKGPRGRSKDEARFYNVDLERGPTGFGFSLRGGSEYNMGLYVLGLMEGGPAQRSNKIQVSDQLVEINGDSTSGMTHSQAVEQIRRGGHRIHLILKKGNGYVPDYGPEEGALSPSSSSHTEETHVETVAVTTASLSQQQRGGGGTEGGGGGGGERRKTRREGETKRRTTGGRGGLGPPDLDLDAVEKEAREEEEERRRRSQTLRQKGKWENQREQGRRSRSLPRISARSWDALLPPEGVEMEEEEEEEEEEERRRRSETKSRRRVTAANREGEERQERDDITPRRAKHSGSSGAPQKTVFSFLMPRDDESEFDSQSAASFSEVSQSAASVATAAGWREDSDWRRAESLWQQGNAPGPWLKPSPQKLTKVLIGCRLGGREALSL